MSVLKLQLVNDTYGTCEIDNYDADNLDNFTENIQRGKDLGNDGLVYQFSTELKFPQAARNFLYTCYKGLGIEAVIIVNIYELNPNSYNFFLQSTGQIKMGNFKWDELSVTTNLDQVGFNSVFTNLMSQDVAITDETIPLGGAKTIPMHSKNGTVINVPVLPKIRLQAKTILKEFSSTSDVSVQYIYNTINAALEHYYLTPDTLAISLNELSTVNPSGFFVDEDINVFFAKPLYTALEAGQLKVRTKYTWRFYAEPLTTTANVVVTIHLVQKNSIGVTVSDTVLDSGGGHAPFGGLILLHTFVTDVTNNFTVSLGDQFFIYADFDSTDPIVGTPDIASIGMVLTPAITLWDFQQATTFVDTTATCIMAYELMERLVQYYTGIQDCFRSTALGRTDSSRVYPEDGFASMICFSNGWAVRNIANNPLVIEDRNMFFNFKDTMTTLCNVWGLSWGFEIQPDGTFTVVIEKKSYFYNKANIIMDLGEVGKADTLPVEAIDITRYQQSISFGYQQIKQIQTINSVDEFNQGRVEATPLTTVNTPLDLTVKDRASGYEIESQRRLVNSTVDSPLDNDNFIICTLRDGPVDPFTNIQDFKNERSESFSAVTSLYDPGSSYNLRISPMRNIIRFLDSLSSNVLRNLDKVIKFASGTGNYAMSSLLAGEPTAVKENQNLDCSKIIPYSENTEFTFDKEITKEQWIYIGANLYGVFKFTIYGEVCFGYIDTLARTNSTKETNFILLRANGVNN